MSLRPLALGLAAASLAGCPKQALTVPLSMHPQEETVEPASTLGFETDEVTDRLQTFLTKLSENEGRVGPMTAEIQSFSEDEVTQGMLARYHSFSDQWWGYVNESNQTRVKETPLILPAHPTEDPIFTEMIIPIVRGMELNPVERRALLEDYRFRTLTGLHTDMEQLFETKLKPIASNVLRGDPQALTAFEGFKTDFDALEERFMLFQYLDFAQILGLEREQFEEVTTSTWETDSDDLSDIYSRQWSKWAEWYSTAFYFLAIRHFDEQRAETTQQALENANCESLGHGDCVNEAFDPIQAWTASLTFAERALEDDYPIDDMDRLTQTMPPVYLSTGVNFEFLEYPVVVFSHSGMETRLNISDGNSAFPAYCELVRNRFNYYFDGSTYYDANGTSGSDELHFPIVFNGFRSHGSQKCQTTYYDPKLHRDVTHVYICTSAENPYYVGGRRSFDREDESSAALSGDLETMTTGFCKAEEGFKPIVDGTLAFSDLSLGESRLYASCISDGCEGQTATHILPVDFFEQLARETVARSWTSTAATK